VRNKRKKVMYVAQLKIPRMLGFGEFYLRQEVYQSTHGKSDAIAQATAARAGMERYRDRLMDHFGRAGDKPVGGTLPRPPAGVRIVPRRKKTATVRG
jgi:hypothetical protein